MSVRVVMLQGTRRSARYKVSTERDKEESTEDAARDSHAKDTVEDNDGPGSDRDRVQLEGVYGSAKIIIAYLHFQVGVRIAIDRRRRCVTTCVFDCLARDCDHNG